MAYIDRYAESHKPKEDKPTAKKKATKADINALKNNAF